MAVENLAIPGSSEPGPHAFAKRCTRLTPHPLPHPSSPLQRLPRYLTQAEVVAFFRAISDLRDGTLFALIYHYGLRVVEVALLTRGDIDLERSRVVTVRRIGSHGFRGWGARGFRPIGCQSFSPDREPPVFAR